MIMAASGSKMRERDWVMNVEVEEEVEVEVDVELGGMMFVSVSIPKPILAANEHSICSNGAAIVVRSVISSCCESVVSVVEASLSLSLSLSLLGEWKGERWVRERDLR